MSPQPINSITEESSEKYRNIYLKYAMILACDFVAEFWFF